MALKRYIKSLGKIYVACDCCGALDKTEKFRHRPQQFVSDYLPKVQTICKKCLYARETGSKGRRKAIKDNKLINEGNA